ncbi:hypothetical protein RN001_014556 [Aquatica leii]|uniref:Uncharacterized protein n=1 Tax=Aquatica leii TaxID=1421715 RepID=A0AAN7PPH6_9COLE|nr:hypothetical protein RN001_014556 [Aquatica leii]
MEGSSKYSEPNIFNQHHALRNYYPMTKEKLGNVYIFNHTKFDIVSLGERFGSMKDCKDIEEVFQNLKFDVVIYNDLAHTEILKELSEIAAMNHANIDCLVIFVLTHGKNGKIFARDTDYYPDVYWKSFNDCPSLMYKPKLIFIQAPCGDDTDDGVRINPVAHTDGPTPTTYSIPYVPDVLLMYSCYDGFTSWRSPVTGSSFVQCLCKEFKLRAKNADLLTLLTFLNRRMSMDFILVPSKSVSSSKPQIATIVSTLNRVLFNLHYSFSDYYPMSKEKLGHVYVFNHVTFDSDSLGPRYGTMKDCRDIEEVFQNLKFDVIIYNDLGYKEILQKLSNIGKMNYSNYSCLIIFVLTHGKNGKLFARDTDYYPDVYWKIFNDSASLRHKPKLIFIQDSCGDEAEDEIYNVSIHPAAQADSVKSCIIPHIPDVLLMYSCYDGPYSWRSSVTGSSFVQCICKEFTQTATTADLLTILTFINRRMSLYFIKLPDKLSDDKKQVGTVVSTLTRILYFGTINQ